MDGSILSIGTFTQPATAVNQTIIVPSDLDYLRVYNWTQINAQGNIGLFTWMRNSPFPTQGISIAINGAVNLTAANSFTLYNPNNQNLETVGPAINITNINAGTGVVLTGNTAGVFVGSTIRLQNVAAAQQLGGINFVVTAVNANVSFTIVPPTPTAAIGATTGQYRLITSAPLFVPRDKVLSNVTAAASAVVTTTANHGFQVGQTVRFHVPQVSATEYGMTQLDGLSGTITAVGSATSFTVNINSTAFTAFAFPAAGNVPFSLAQVTPFGDDTGTALAQVPPLSSLEDSVQNTGFIGITLTAGANLPGGVAADVVTWEAGKVMFGGL